VKNTVPSAGPTRTGAGRTTGGVDGPKVADTSRSPVIVRVQVAVVPGQAPPHVVNTNPADGTAVRVTDCPAVVVVSHVGGQLSPAPVTLPPLDTVTVRNRLAAFVTYIAVHGFVFTYQTLELLREWVGGSTAAFPKDSNASAWPYALVNAIIFAAGLGLVWLGHRLRSRRQAKAAQPVDLAA
jgi:hypothetical protein